VLNRYSFGFALLLTIALLAISWIREPNFGWQDQLANFAPLALAAMASTPAIISGGGGFDLSISPLMYLSGEIFIVWLAPHSLGGLVSVPIILLVGLAFGALNGILIAVLRVQPVVVTLSMGEESLEVKIQDQGAGVHEEMHVPDIDRDELWQRLRLSVEIGFAVDEMLQEEDRIPSETAFQYAANVLRGALD